jgi:hypothetical protein
MAYGACDTCGCSKEECECAPLFAFDLIHPEVQRFSPHGTFVRDYECFRIVRRLSVQEAFELMDRSTWIKTKTKNPSENMLGMDEWAIACVNKDLGYVEIVSRVKKYAMYRSGINSFLRAIERAPGKILRSLYADIAYPNDT